VVKHRLASAWTASIAQEFVLLLEAGIGPLLVGTGESAQPECSSQHFVLDSLIRISILPGFWRFALARNCLK